MSTDDPGATPPVDSSPAADVRRSIPSDAGPSPQNGAGHDGLQDEDHDAMRRRRRPGTVLISLGALAAVLLLVAGGGFWFLTERYAGSIDRVVDVFADIDEGARPAPATPAQPAADDPVTFLLVGSDTRAQLEPGETPDGRSDAIMLARFAADRRHAQVISIPRDSWVNIPGYGMDKINAAYAFEGPSLLIQTVEEVTGVRVDHYAAIDFDGLIQVTDDLGGVDVVVAETTSHGPYAFPAGLNHLNGDEARWYLGQRYGLAGGDLDRVRRQQQYLQAMFGKLFSSDTFTDPARLDAALLAVTSAVKLDDTLGNGELLSLAYSLRNLTPEDVEFFTAPVLGLGMEGPASVVYLNQTAGERMWEYLRNDSLGQNADEFADDALPEVPR